MGSKVISFRFNDAEVEALQALQQVEDDDSLNQTASRLLRSLLGTSTPSRDLSTSVDIQEIVKREVENAIANSERLQELQQIITKVDERLGELNA